MWWGRILPVLLSTLICSASSGDRSTEFQECVLFCDTQRCTASGQNWTPSLALRLTQWTCEDDCKYTCMHDVTEVASGHGNRIHQFYGKWPFWRILGMQEPASVLFSLLNLWAHWKGLRMVQRRIPEEFPMKKHYVQWAWISMNAWVWSAVFHTRDKPLTEKLDYFSAALSILYALYTAVMRLFFIYPKPASHFASVGNRASYFILWTTLCTVVYIGHVSYLALLPRFDYTYNIIFNLVIGLAHNFLWLTYSFPSSLTVIRRFPSSAVSASYRPHFASTVFVLVLFTSAATALELFDFPPWFGAVDAHALWHLATAPIAPFWYTFLVEDALDDGWRAVGRKS